MFFKGLALIPSGKIGLVKTEIMQALNITTDRAYRDRRSGSVNYTFDDVMVVNSIFAKYGVEDPWGAAPEQSKQIYNE